MEHVTTLAPLARCTTRGCAWRWRSGPDRPCWQHQRDDGDLAAAAAALGIELAPGDRGDSPAPGGA
jgi:hypothetical protein